MPSMPNRVDRGPRSGLTARAAEAPMTGWLCQPLWAMTKSPGSKRSEFDSTTRLTASPVIRPPSGMAPLR